jgi:serine/threonine protein kinase/Tfp pilus assembly protein PilF
MIGKTISHYRIIEELGRGGMGLVYKAEDTKLNRTVALKFLPPELTHDQESKERFIREAHAASALEHNNICTIHEIDETDEGQLFIVMACYEGQTLKEKIKACAERSRSDQRLKTKEAIDIITQIAKGLHKAHEKGIVHRDIKPANIFITDDGSVKILDFGLAKLAGKAQLTKDSSTLGTVAYMSPEQLRGQEVDHRTDIWSLGVVLYEMLTGETPFAGDYEQAIAYAILNEIPKPIENKQNELGEVLNSVLAKDPEKRYTNIEDLLHDLNTINLRTGTNYTVQKSNKISKNKATIITVVVVFILFAIISIFYFYQNSKINTSIKSMAVLPFLNIKENPEHNYIGFAIADEIITDLSYLKELTIRPASSIRKYYLKDIDPSNVAIDLNVDLILTGSYQIEINDIRLHIEMIHVKRNEIMWQQEIKERFDNVLRIQELVTDKVIDGLKINFSSDERNRMIIDEPKNSTAYDYYQLSLVKPTTTKGNQEAINLLEKSIIYDSTYAPAFNQLGFRIHSLTSYNLQGVWKLEEAEIALRKALNLNPDMLKALGNLARIYTETGRIIEAQKLVKQMLYINNNNAFAHFVQGYIFRYAGLLNVARKEMEIAVSIDPTDKSFKSLGITYFYLGEYEKAIKTFDIDKGSWYALTYQGITLTHMGKTNIAREYFTSVINMDPASYSANLSIAYRAYIEENIAEAKKGLKLIEHNNPVDADIWFFVSTAYALLEDSEATVKTVRKAVETGFYVYPLLERYPYFDFIRDDQEFQKILELAKQKHKAFKQKYFADKE